MWLAVAFTIEVLGIATAGIKSCGDLRWGVYFVVFLIPGFFIKFTWLVIPLALAFGLGGIAHASVPRHHGILRIGAAVLAVVVIILTALYIPRSSSPCSPI